LTSAIALIRRLRPEEAAAFRVIRVEALATNPEAFETTLEKQAAEPLSRFADTLKSAAVFGAFRHSEIVGMAGFFVHRGQRTRHKGVLWGMYVRPAVRRQGFGRALVRGVVVHAREHVEQILLSVVSTNEAARRLYSQEGFLEYGLEKRSLKQDGQYFDEILMARFLS
jgi:ribosomal protein S18 acetylase RimI-like enzyme